MKRVTKKIIVDTKALNEYLKNRGMDYKDLAEITGLSTTQAYNLTKRPVGGAVTFGYLIGLGIPFFLLTYEHNGNKKRVINAQRIELKAV